MHQNRSEARIERQRDARRENERPIGCEGVREGEEPCRQPDTGLRNKEQLVRRTLRTFLFPKVCEQKHSGDEPAGITKPYPTAVAN